MEYPSGCSAKVRTPLCLSWHPASSLEMGKVVALAMSPIADAKTALVAVRDDDRVLCRRTLTMARVFVDEP